MLKLRVDSNPQNRTFEFLNLKHILENILAILRVLLHLIFWETESLLIDKFEYLSIFTLKLKLFVAWV